MKHPPETGLRSRRGSLLVFVLGVLLAAGVLLAGVLSLSRSAVETQLMVTSGNHAHLIAESGLRIAQALYCDDPESWDDQPIRQIQLQDGDLITVELQTAPVRRFVVLATAYAGTSMESRAQVFGQVPDDCEDDPDDDEYGPDEYVIASWSAFDLPSGTDIDGSVYGESVTLNSSNSIVTRNIVSETFVTLSSGSTVGGSICARNGDLRLRASNTVVEGDVSVFGNVILESGTEIRGTVYATGSVTLQSSNARIGGDVHAGGTVLSSRGTIGGSVYAGWNLQLNNQSSIGGDAHAANNVIRGSGGAPTITGSAYAGGNTNDFQPANVGVGSPPLLPPQTPAGCPPVPPKPVFQSFLAGADDYTIPQSSTSRMPAGTYRNLDIGGGATLILEAGDCATIGQPGCYVLASFGPARWGQTLRLDFSTGDEISVFVTGDIAFSGPVEVSFDGSSWTRIDNLDQAVALEVAKRSYWETYGGFSIGTNNSRRQWLGTVLSEDDITLPSGFFGVGALVTRNGTLNVQSANPTILYAIADFAREHWVP